MRFEKSNRATKRKRRIQNSTRKFKELELEIRHENLDDKFEREPHIRNSTRKLEFKVRHENEKASRRTTGERREAHSHETRTHSHETAPERTPETHTSNERLF